MERRQRCRTDFATVVRQSNHLPLCSRSYLVCWRGPTFVKGDLQAEQILKRPLLVDDNWPESWLVPAGQGWG